MMKKLASVLLTVCAIFVLASCSQPLASNSAIGAEGSKALSIGQGKEIIAYFCDWSIYDGHDQYRVSKIPFDKLTIINFSFVSIVDNVHSLFDGFKRYTQEKFSRTVQKYEIAWLDANADVEQSFGIPGVPWKGEFAGVLGQLKYYKQQYPHLKVIPSVGGWTKGHMFSEMASSAAARATFVQSCVTFAREYNLDGVDIDWEYPGINRAAAVGDQYDWGCPGKPEDKQNFTTLMKELREAFNAASIADNKTYLVTAAMGIGYDKFAKTEVDKYPQYLDYINLMTYDMHGAWENVTGHHAPIHKTSNAPYTNTDIRDKYNIDYAIQQFLDAGVPASKLTLGLPFYSRGWSGVPVGDDANLPGLYETASGSFAGKWDNPSTPGGQTPYFDVKNRIASGELTVYNDPVADASYAYGNGKFYTFDTAEQIRKKSNMIMQKGLGGAMIWEIDGDTWMNGSYELTNVIFDVLYGGPQPTATPTNTPDPNATATNTPVPTATSTPVPTPTATATPGGCTYPEWNASQGYAGNTIVHYIGHNWKSKWGTLPGDIPALNAPSWATWIDLGACGSSTNPTPTPTATQATPTSTATLAATATATSGTGTSTWQLNATYTAGTVVTYNGKSYKCLVTHTAYSATWNPADAATLWQES